MGCEEDFKEGFCQRTNASHSRLRGRFGKGSIFPVRFYYGIKKNNKTKMQVRKGIYCVTPLIPAFVKLRQEDCQEF